MSLLTLNIFNRGHLRPSGVFIINFEHIQQFRDHLRPSGVFIINFKHIQQFRLRGVFTTL